MLKKKIVMLIAAAMMTLSASSAFAAFGDLELIRVVYERTTGSTETATDLGTINSILATGGTFAGSALTATTPANLRVAYFALDRTTNNLWATSTTGVDIGSLVTMKSATTGVYSYYNSLPVTTTATGQASVTGLQSSGNSYKVKMSTTAANMGGALPINTGEVSLGSLVGATSGSVSQNLYFWANGNSTVAANKIGVLAATITTSFDGLTTVAPVSSTPIPPAFFLMGSGLLGMFGLRRKNKVA